MVNNLPAMQETQVQSLGQEDPLEAEMATYSSIPAWEIPWREEPDRLQVHSFAELDTTERLTHTQKSDPKMLSRAHIVLFLFAFFSYILNIISIPGFKIIWL